MTLQTETAVFAETENIQHPTWLIPENWSHAISYLYNKLKD
jgi:hypothetical protein